MATGLRFDQAGRVSLYAGEPCAPQIMFDFHGAGSTVSLAAPMWATKLLTDAATKTSATIRTSTFKQRQRQAGTTGTTGSAVDAVASFAWC